MPSNVLPLHLKQTFLPIIWIFTEIEGDGIKSRLPFKMFSTLKKQVVLGEQDWTFPYTSAANQAQFGLKWAGLAMPVSRQNPNSFYIFFLFLEQFF